MTVIAVCNQKGGPGKTTLAINLDRAFAADGMGVLLLDMDPQGSALDWGSTPSGRAFTAHLLKPPPNMTDAPSPGRLQRASRTRSMWLWSGSDISHPV